MAPSFIEVPTCRSLLDGCLRHTFYYAVLNKQFHCPLGVFSSNWKTVAHEPTSEIHRRKKSEESDRLACCRLGYFPCLLELSPRPYASPMLPCIRDRSRLILIATSGLF